MDISVAIVGGLVLLVVIAASGLIAHRVAGQAQAPIWSRRSAAARRVDRQQAGAPSVAGAPSAPATNRPGGTGYGGAVRVAEHGVIEFMRRHSLMLMRIALAVVFLWFGVLKLLDASPVADLVARGLPFLPPRAAVLFSGITECLIGLGLLSGRAVRTTLVLFFGLLLGTFLPVFTHPADVFQHNNPLWLSATGEFILKNFILITAGFTILGSLPKRGSEDQGARGTASGGTATSSRVSPEGEG